MIIILKNSLEIINATEYLFRLKKHSYILLYHAINMYLIILLYFYQQTQGLNPKSILKGSLVNSCEETA